MKIDLTDIPEMKYPPEGYSDPLLTVVDTNLKVRIQLSLMMTKHAKSPEAVLISQIARYYSDKIYSQLTHEEREAVRDGIVMMGERVPSKHRQFYWRRLTAAIIESLATPPTERAAALPSMPAPEAGPPAEETAHNTFVLDSMTNVMELPSPEPVSENSEKSAD
jgi:hypothetical protein